MENNPRFGEIMYAQLPYCGSVQGGIRPVLVAQNDVGNRHAPTVEIIPLSSRIYKGNHMPTHVFVPRETPVSRETASSLRRTRRRSRVIFC